MSRRLLVTVTPGGPKMGPSRWSASAAMKTPPREAGVGGEEAGQQGAVGDLAVGLDLGQFRAVDDLDVRAAAGAGGDDDFGQAVAVEVVRGHADAAAEAGVEGEEAGQQGAVGDLAVGLDLTQLGAVDDLDVRAAAGAGADDDVALNVVEADRHEDAAAEGGVEGEEAGQQGAVGDLAVGLDLAQSSPRR